VTRILPDTATGHRVQEGQPLLTVYGRDFEAAQRTFLFALRAAENPPPGTSNDSLDQPSQTLREARRLLRNLGMGEAELQQLTATRQLMLDVTLVAPGTGLVLERHVLPKQRFERGAELFRIADLSHVWIVADLFGGDESYVRSGSTAQVSLPDRASAVQATVTEALARFDGGSRALQLRLKAENPGLIFRPGMYVDLAFSVSLPEATTVPAEAIVESGLRNTVFVARGDGIFEPRTVEVGWRSGGHVEIIHGLTPGESIVVSGNFLLDSESRIRREDPDRHD